MSRIISKNAIVRFGLAYTYRDGFLTDPYKKNDRRPDEREEWVLGTNAETYHDVAVFRCGQWYFRDPADGRDRACQWAECLWYFRDYFTVGL